MVPQRMAVPGRRNGLMDSDDEGDALFEEDDGLIAQPESDIPPHLRDLAAAAECGDLNALRRALGYSQIVELLIDRSNDPDCVKRMLESVDVEGDTPLHHAARGEHVNVVRFLLAAGASPAKTNIYGKTPSELADPDTEARRILEAAVNAQRSRLITVEDN